MTIPTRCTRLGLQRAKLLVSCQMVWAILAASGVVLGARSSAAQADPLRNVSKKVHQYGRCREEGRDEGKDCTKELEEAVQACEAAGVTGSAAPAGAPAPIPPASTCSSDRDCASGCLVIFVVAERLREARGIAAKMPPPTEQRSLGCHSFFRAPRIDVDTDPAQGMIAYNGKDVGKAPTAVSLDEEWEQDSVVARIPIPEGKGVRHVAGAVRDAVSTSWETPCTTSTLVIHDPPLGCSDARCTGKCTWTVETARGRFPCPAAPAPCGPECQQTVAPDQGRSQRTVGLIVGGAGVVAGVGAAVAFLKSDSMAEQAEDYCGVQGNPNWCEPRGLELDADSKFYGDVAWVGAAVGGAALVTGAVLYFTAPSSEGPRETAIRLDLAPSTEGVMVQGRANW